MALPATDAFTGTNGDPLSGNWTTVNGAWNVNSNRIRPTAGSGSNSLAYWNADAFNNDQYAQGKVYPSGGETNSGVAVRVAATRGYYLRATTTAVVIGRMDDGSTATDLSTIGSLTIADGDTIKLSISGTVLTAYQNGSSVGTYDTVSDGTTYGSGSAGIYAFATNQGWVDDFLADNVGGGGPTAKNLTLLGVG